MRFRKSREEKTVVPAVREESDPLHEAEEEAFRASVLEARERALRRPVPNAPAPEPDIEMVWNEQEDVYRPTEVDGRELLASLRPHPPVEAKLKQSCILVRRGMMQRIQSHLRSDRSIELGGLLAGQVFRDVAMESYFIVVEEAFPALDGHGTATRFEYTSASWEAITPRLESMDAAWTVVGSYHSHPDVGVFLSQTDKETQADVFSHDWQIALVIDPVRDEIGFFIGERGAPCACWRIIS